MKLDLYIRRSGPASNTLLAAARAYNKFSIRVLAPALASLRVLDATRTLATALALTAPEESPVIRISSELVRSRSIAFVSFTSTVGSTVVGIILVIDLEDSKGLLARDTGVVGAFSGLDGVGGLGGWLYR